MFLLLDDFINTIIEEIAIVENILCIAVIEEGSLLRTNQSIFRTEHAESLLIFIVN